MAPCFSFRRADARFATIAGLLATTIHVGGMMDAAQSPVLILEFAGSLVVLGAANVLREAVSGLSKGLSRAAEHAGQEWGNAMFAKVISSKKRLRRRLSARRKTSAKMKEWAGSNTWARSNRNTRARSSESASETRDPAAADEMRDAVSAIVK